MAGRRAWSRLLAVALLVGSSTLTVGHAQSASAPDGARETRAQRAARKRADKEDRAMERSVLRSRFKASGLEPSIPTAIPLGTSAMISSDELESLPLGPQGWQSLLPDTPLEQGQAGSEDQPQSRSNRGAATVMVDGSTLRMTFGQAGVGRWTGRGGMLLGPASSLSAVSEVGREGVGFGAGEDSLRRIRLTLRSGGDQLHGSVSFFSRQNFMGAQNPLTDWVKLTTPGTDTSVPGYTAFPYTAGNREMLWGGRAGGRVGRRAVHWFASVNGYRRNSPGAATVRHPENFFAQPSNDQMQVLAARLGLSAANPVGEGIQAYSAMLETLAGLLGPAARSTTQWTSLGRADWALGTRDRFFVEGTGAGRSGPGSGLSRASEFYGTHSFGQRQTSEQWLLGQWVRTVSEKLLLVTSASFAHHALSAGPQPPSAYEQTLNVSSWGRLPQINVDTRYGFTIGNPARLNPGSYPDEHLYAAQEQAAWQHGRLMLRAGANLRHSNDATTLLTNQTGTYSYSTVENFVSDALVFAKYGLNGQLNPYDQHNCDQTGRVWRDATGQLHGLGYLPCYSHYTQTIGPNNWWMSSNDWAGYGTAEWTAASHLTFTLGLRWQHEQLPAPIAALNNPDLPLTARMPALGSEWAPRAGLAWQAPGRFGPVVRLGYGMDYGRTRNATVLSALTQTGSAKGDLRYILKPTDNLNGGGAPPFPYVLAGAPATVVKPQVVEFGPRFRNPEVHQAEVAFEERLPSHTLLEAAAVVALGRRLPVITDANIDPAVNPKTITYQVVDGNGTGPIKTPTITVPFYANWPSATSPTGFAGRLNNNYQQIAELESTANSTFEAVQVQVVRRGRNGLTVHARYRYAHTTDWNPSETLRALRPSVFDPANPAQEHGTSNLDVRHSLMMALIWEPHWHAAEWTGRVVNGWVLSGTGFAHSGLPYSMRTAGSLAKEFTSGGAAIVALEPGMLGYGGANLVFGVGRNTYRYPGAWKADLRLGKRIRLGSQRELEMMAETYNLFNHQNVTRIERIGYTIQAGTLSGELPRLTYLTGLKTGSKEFGRPLAVSATSFYRQRQIQFGMRFRF
ncbi:MAG TPA: TonB-dependent receptor [Terracidiphilus sp.]|nr:TonB-dependent receptor [Terracidiphilus sp.]